MNNLRSEIEQYKEKLVRLEDENEKRKIENDIKLNNNNKLYNNNHQVP